ncbi:MAG: acyl carrier protein [bacterium]|nr:MAG: acyl carrier protein [bacterium]
MIQKKIIELVRETLGLPDNESIALDQLLFYDLAFTSMDMLDLIFRTEQSFNISIPEGTILNIARGDIPDSEFTNDGILTKKGRDKLMSLLYDSPKEIFPERIHINTLPRYCTVGAMARLVEYKLKE